MGPLAALLQFRTTAAALKPAPFSRMIPQVQKSGMGARPVPLCTSGIYSRELPVTQRPRPAVLTLADGTIFRGISIGAEGDSAGEVVFNTAMTGYQEILTDPSYCRQIITLTYPHIGNTGVNQDDAESGKVNKVYAAGLVIRDLPLASSNWRQTQTLPEYLKKQGVVAIADIDTRKLTRLLREKGAQAGCLMAGRIDEAAALRRAREFPGLTGMDLAAAVSCGQPYSWSEGEWARGRDYQMQEHPRFHVAAYDFGIKRNILRKLAQRGCKVTVLPAQTSADEVLALQPDGVFLSNGPGDPEPCDYAIPRNPRTARWRICPFRHLPGPSTARTSQRRPNRQDEVRPSWRQPSGAGSGYRARDDHQPESRIRGGCGDAAPECARHACVAVRRQPAGLRPHRPAGVLFPGPSRSKPRAARRGLPVRSIHPFNGAPKRSRSDMAEQVAPKLESRRLWSELF